VIAPSSHHYEWKVEIFGSQNIFVVLALREIEDRSSI
jgi:hypothetical protein